MFNTFFYVFGKVLHHMALSISFMIKKESKKVFPKFFKCLLTSWAFANSTNLKTHKVFFQRNSSFLSVCLSIFFSLQFRDEKDDDEFCLEAFWIVCHQSWEESHYETVILSHHSCFMTHHSILVCVLFFALPHFSSCHKVAFNFEDESFFYS